MQLENQYPILRGPNIEVGLHSQKSDSKSVLLTGNVIVHHCSCIFQSDKIQCII